jgi:hypothetical protein
MDECPMIDDCAGYDRDLRVCYFQRADCEFATVDDEAVSQAPGAERQPFGVAGEAAPR